MESLDQKETGDEKVTAPFRSLTPQNHNRAPAGSGGGRQAFFGAPAEAQRSGFGGERRSKEAGEVFADLGRKRSKADFATTRAHFWRSGRKSTSRTDNSRKGGASVSPAGASRPYTCRFPHRRAGYFLSRKRKYPKSAHRGRTPYAPPAQLHCALLFPAS